MKHMDSLTVSLLQQIRFPRVSSSSQGSSPDCLVFTGSAALVAFGAGSELVPVGTFQLQTYDLLQMVSVSCCAPSWPVAQLKILLLAFHVQPFTKSRMEYERRCWALVYSKSVFLPASGLTHFPKNPSRAE